MNLQCTVIKDASELEDKVKPLAHFNAKQRNNLLELELPQSPKINNDNDDYYYDDNDNDVYYYNDNDNDSNDDDNDNNDNNDGDDNDDDDDDDDDDG